MTSMWADTSAGTAAKAAVALPLRALYAHCTRMMNAWDASTLPSMGNSCKQSYSRDRHLVAQLPDLIWYLLRIICSTQSHHSFQTYGSGIEVIRLFRVL